MGFFSAACDTFVGVCSTVALTVTTVTEWASYFLHANYVFVSSLYTAACSALTLLFAALDIFFQAVFTVLLYLWDFLSEVYACVCALVILVWRLGVLLYKAACLVLAGLEMVAVGVWSGGAFTMHTLQQAAQDVVDTCQSTTDHVRMLTQDAALCVCAVFTAVGEFCTGLVRGMWLGLGYLPATLASVPSSVARWFGAAWSSGVARLWQGVHSISTETCVGISVCLVLYVLLTKLCVTLHARRFASLSFWRSRLRRQPRPDTTHMTFDIGFDSDFDEEDFDPNNSAEGSDGGGDSEESDAQTELTLSDEELDEENSPGSESDVSLNSQTFSSEDSEQEIDVQLPEASHLRSRHSRSCTPSRGLPKGHDDFERELERERDKRKCVVCQDANKTVLILPCKHMCLCVACANHIVRSRFGERRICPLCRGRIERVMDVFV